jgi:hypothetical protein
MKNNFTTPSFAKVLKEHGIEIESCFVILIWDSDNYSVAVKSNDGSCIDLIGYKHWLNDFSDILPAYPLTQVLGWLPQYLENEDGHPEWWLEVSSKNYGNLAANYKSEKTGYSKLNKADLEQLITQGLTEGWLTKDNLNLKAK